MKLRIFLAAAVGFCLSPLVAHAQTPGISTGFSTNDGFTTGDFTPLTLSDVFNPAFTATFSGGQQVQGFDGPSYESGGNAYLFVDGTFTGGFGNTISGDGTNDNLGLIDFSGPGAGSVSFFGANRSPGGGSFTARVYGVDDATLLSTLFFVQTSLNNNPVETTLTETSVGGAIGSIEFTIGGTNPTSTFVAAIDSFNATASTSAIPEPASALGFGFLGMCYALRRRKR